MNESLYPLFGLSVSVSCFLCSYSSFCSYIVLLLHSLHVDVDVYVDADVDVDVDVVVVVVGGGVAGHARRCAQGATPSTWPMPNTAAPVARSAVKPPRRGQRGTRLCPLPLLDTDGKSFMKMASINWGLMNIAPIKFTIASFFLQDYLTYWLKV